MMQFDTALVCGWRCHDAGARLRALLLPDVWQQVRARQIGAEDIR